MTNNEWIKHKAKNWNQDIEIIRIVSEQPDKINPDHYKVGGIETIDYLKAKLSLEELKGFLKGNIIKYLSRAELKNGAEDYKKASWYMEQLVKLTEE